MSEKNVAETAETAETAEALTSSVSMLEEVKQKKKNFLKSCVRRTALLRACLVTLS